MADDNKRKDYELNSGVGGQVMGDIKTPLGRGGARGSYSADSSLDGADGGVHAAQRTNRADQYKNREQQPERPRKSGSSRGFASMDQAKQRSIASAGGKAAHLKGTAHEFNSEEARAAGRKGGQASRRNAPGAESKEA